MKLKYIVTENNDFAIFTTLSNHDDVARGLYGKPVGAGFCDIDVGFKTFESDAGIVDVHCYGKSISLGIESREVDEKIINGKIND